MPLFASLEDAARFKGIADVLKGVESRDRVDLAGLEGGAVSWVLANLSSRLRRPILVVARDPSAARGMVHDLRFFLEAVEGKESGPEAVVLFPGYEFGPYSHLVPHRDEEIERSAALFRLSQVSDWRFAVVPAEALGRRLVPREAFNARCDVFMAGEEEERGALSRRLVSAGYMNASIVEEPGSFALRGEVVDIFPPYTPRPFRLEFFGDLIERIREFDPTTQRTLRDVQEVYLHPARQALLPENEESRAGLERRVRAAADEVDQPTVKTDRFIEDLLSGSVPTAASAWLGAFYDRLDLVTDYVPDDAVWFIEDPAAARASWKNAWKDAESSYRQSIESGSPALKPSVLSAEPSEIEKGVRESKLILAHAVALDSPHATHDWEISEAVLDLGSQGHDALTEEIRSSSDPLGSLTRQLGQALNDGFGVVLTARTEAQAARATSLLEGRSLRPRKQVQGASQLVEAVSGRVPGLWLAVADLRSGCTLPADRLIFLTEEEIFGKRVHTRPSAKGAAVREGGLDRLAPGEFVVHRDHGIGRYEGLVRRKVDGVEFDFLLIAYHGGDRLYLPVYRLSMVERYSGAEAPSRLDRLGGQTFARKKARLKQELRQMADDLLVIHARRKELSRPPLPPPDEMARALEARFPFEETADQERAIQDVMADLEGPRPMDRLVCGDAGYGKTEVAVRAAFRMVVSGRQVAFLVPTTVLAQQHYLTFQERLRGFPVRVELLSRFRTAAEEAEVLKGLSDGTVDIVVGTHRLLSSDVRFQRLGLMVLDEEQRFGVAQKERLKKLKNQVDVLTLTATPIPRTLHMALMGLRDLSIIGTPPAERRAVRTFVTARDPLLIREAIGREIAREGQVFFVRPRVRGIHEVAEEIRGLVPGARVSVAHGQMRENALEQVMLDFVEGRSDVLVCTTIIESGLDIPRANTILVDEADRFGLAQLYQLRGRVGRGSRSAFGYLLVPPPSQVGAEARERIAALKRYSELGSGFNLAILDMEIRGTGDLLGSRQAGHVAALGLETYLRMLDEARAEMVGEEVREEPDPDLTFDVPGFIPEEYIPDVGQRLALYRRFSSAEDEPEVRLIADEMTDRFGAPPAETLNLVEMMVQKTCLKKLEAVGLDARKGRITVHFTDRTPIDPSLIAGLVRQSPRVYRLTPDLRLTRRYPGREDTPSHVLAHEFLKELLSYASKGATSR